MRRFLLPCLGLAIGGMLLLTPGAHAEVTYTTVGTFSQSGGPVYNDPATGVTITFGNAINNTVDPNPTTQSSLGTFDTTGTTNPGGALTGTFTLDIFQSAPTAGGPVTFLGTLTGSLSGTASSAAVTFPTTILSIGDVSYQIANNDRDQSNTPILGRVDIAPPSTNAGITTINGLITLRSTAVPEPGAVVLFAAGAPILLWGLKSARKRRPIAA